MASQDAQFDRKLAEIFKAEAGQHVQTMLGQITALERAASAAEIKSTAKLLFREAHSLKGAARAVGRIELEGVCHALESVLHALQKGELSWSAGLSALLHDVTRDLDRATAMGQAENPERLFVWVQRLEDLLGNPVPAGTQGAGLEQAADMPEPPAQAATAAERMRQPGPDTVRISVDRLSNLLYQVEELVTAKTAAQRYVLELDHAVQEYAALLAGLRRSGPQPGHAGHGDTVGGAPSFEARDYAAHESRLRNLQQAAGQDQRSLATAVDALLADVKQTLTLPVSSLMSMLTATVRELSRSQGKEVDFKVEGEGLEMDRRLLDELREPLLHLLRNAIDHGIEPAQERLGAGKPPAGGIVLSIEPKTGGSVTVSVTDDGRGVDLERLAQAAQQLGVIPAPEGSSSELLPLVFASGVSTASTLTAVSGRGVGLAIVQDKIERLGGNVTVESQPGRGTRFTMSLPLSLATFRAIEVRAAGHNFLLPIAYVVRCARVSPDELRHVGQRQSIRVGGQDLLLASLAGLLELPREDSGPDSRSLSCLVLRSGDRTIALQVDEVLGEQEVLSKPVPPRLTRANVVAAAAAVGSGQTVPILNVASLVRSAVRPSQVPASSLALRAKTRKRVCSILVAEDSITSRTLLKNILELAGHRVAVAVDGLDALRKLETGSFDLVVSDIEMPGLDGFALTQAIRREPRLADLPVILVTSLASPSDREKGAEAGANAYIVKSSFDQGDLLKAIRELA